VQAALAALDVIGDGGTLLLAYAQPPRGTEREDEEGARLLHTLGSDAAFGRVREELLAAVAGRYVEIEPVMVDRPDAGPGEAAKALLALAEQRGAEVIAVGSRRHGRLDRIMLGSVTTTLARHGERSLLVVPPPPAA
jgi:nucleotide-binding universal stress UspA family protein